MTAPQRKPGRPRILELVTLDEALKLIEDHYGRPMYAKQTLRNKIWKKELTNHGRRHRTLLDVSEIKEKLCS